MTTLSPQHLWVCNDHDLIRLRQVVRQQARAAGLAATQQARFTAAVSEFARLLLREGYGPTFAVGVAATEGGRMALEVSCAAQGAGPEVGLLHALSISPALASARNLVDDLCLLDGGDGPFLAMRMWLAS
jgi:serine/threonine-protein kinase RsbT